METRSNVARRSSPAANSVNIATPPTSSQSLLYDTAVTLSNLANEPVLHTSEGATSLSSSEVPIVVTSVRSESEESAEEMSSGEDDLMPAESLKEWKALHRSQKSVLRFWDDNAFCAKTPQGLLATLAELYFLKDDPVRFRGAYNDLYRWIRYDRQVLKSDTDVVTQEHYSTMRIQHCKNMRESDAVESANLAMPDGVRYALELRLPQRSGKRKWVEFVFVKPSKYRQGGFGLYSAVEMQANHIVGFYVGEVLHRWKQITLSRPTDRLLTHVMRAKLRDDKWNPPVFALNVRDRGGVWETRSPSTFDPDANKCPSLYMGVHYINNAAHVFKDDTQENKRARRGNNVYIEEDGSFVTRKRVEPGDELTCCYEMDDDYEKSIDEMKQDRVDRKYGVPTKYCRKGKAGKRGDGIKKKRASKQKLQSIRKKQVKSQVKQVLH
jgi:hypothetical protein